MPAANNQFLMSREKARAKMFDFYLKHLKSYNEFLEVELEDNPAAEAYFDKIQDCLENMQSLISDDEITKVDLSSYSNANLSEIIEDLRKRQEAISEIALNFTGSEQEFQVKADKGILSQAIMYFFTAFCNEKAQAKLEISEVLIDESQAILRKSKLPLGAYWSFTASTVDSSDVSNTPSLLNGESELASKLGTEEGQVAYSQLLSHGAEIFVSDANDELHILLPAVDSPYVKGQSDQDLQEDAFHGEETILVVDDEDMIWDILIENLQNLGYTVILAENGEDAVEIYKENPGLIDIVILDMVMPKMNGREAFAELRKIDENVKVILSSGFMNEGDAGDLMEGGALTFMRKPYKLIDLAKTLRKHLS